jgi:hypothetical protein
VVTGVAFADSTAQTAAVPVGGGALRRLCPDCSAFWSPDGAAFYVVVDRSSSSTAPGRTVRIPVPSGQSMPVLPAAGVLSVEEWLGLPGATLIPHGAVAAGASASAYAFSTIDDQRNLFRIPIH